MAEQNRIKKIVRKSITAIWAWRSYPRDYPLMYVPLCILFFAIVFKDKFKEVLSKVLVEPLLSSVKEPGYAVDAFLLILVFVVLYSFIWKGIRHVRLSPVLILSIFVLALLYFLNSVVQSGAFLFVHFRTDFLSPFRLLDVLFIPFFGFVIYCLIIWAIPIKKDGGSTTSDGFYSDDPVVLDDDTDMLARYGYVEELRKRILATRRSRQSFAIGIIGKWGSGKTTFIETLENNFERENESEVIQLRFNPWATGHTEGITSVFFENLAIKLSEFDDTLKSKVLSYGRELIKSIGDNGLSWVNTLFSLFAHDKDLNEKHDVIDKAINRLGRKVIVYIDDVDRLDKREIIEVLRIIRNTANFSNTYFVVAFDKSYVVEGIRTALDRNADTFLEKIFQVEYYLPAPGDRFVFSRKLIAELNLILEGEDRDVLYQMNHPASNIASEILPPVNKYIQSFRDVNRYMNTFLLSYDRVKGNVYLPDYIGICLLRLKFPQVAQLLYDSKFSSVSGLYDDSIFSVDEGILWLGISEGSDTKVEGTFLFKELTRTMGIMSLTEYQIKAAAELVLAIFQPKARGYNMRKRTLQKEYLSVTFLSSFDRYFDYSLAGRLDEADFKKAWEGPWEDFESAILRWNEERTLANDLRLKFGSLTGFASRSLFEQAIRGIVYFANLPSSTNKGYINGFTPTVLYEILGGANNRPGDVLRQVYNDDKREFVVFFTSFFTFENTKGVWGAMQDLASRLIKEEEGGFLMTSLELQELLVLSFYEALERSLGVPESLMQFYNQLIRLYTDPEKPDITPIGRGIEITERFRAKVGDELRVFLSWNVVRDGRSGGYYPGNWPKIVFESDDQFQALLQSQKDISYVAEYLEFQERWRKNKELYPQRSADNWAIGFEFDELKWW